VSLKALVNNHTLFQSFLSELDDMIEKERKVLEQTQEPITIYRSQGSISTLNKLKKLRDVVNARDA